MAEMGWYPGLEWVSLNLTVDPAGRRPRCLLPDKRKQRAGRGEAYASYRLGVSVVRTGRASIQGLWRPPKPRPGEGLRSGGAVRGQV